MLGVLIGSSGRKTDGTINRNVLRSAGYCKTIREALEFSALLRQSRKTSRKEKLKYINIIINLLEMYDIENCLVGTPGGAGLSVEQRKRLTIRVELTS
ncbi:hypothetical protein DL95DRAFT_395636 [Leptodontidium sp. 2 PMI_412]|nr:hypothetical protein DL95DRAFT_395636 [Leptodontidium sp. 2 PMI_412]